MKSRRSKNSCAEQNKPDIPTWSHSHAQHESLANAFPTDVGCKFPAAMNNPQDYFFGSWL